VLTRVRLGVSGSSAGGRIYRRQLDKLELLLAHRPNVSYPTFAAKTFATLDQISDGR